MLVSKKNFIHKKIINKISVNSHATKKTNNFKIYIINNVCVFSLARLELLFALIQLIGSMRPKFDV